MAFHKAKLPNRATASYVGCSCSTVWRWPRIVANGGIRGKLDSSRALSEQVSRIIGRPCTWATPAQVIDSAIGNPCEGQSQPAESGQRFQLVPPASVTCGLPSRSKRSPVSPFRSSNPSSVGSVAAERDAREGCALRPLLHFHERLDHKTTGI